MSPLLVYISEGEQGGSETSTDVGETGASWRTGQDDESALV